MPFSSQPLRKKGKPKLQEAQKPSCGSSVSQKPKNSDQIKKEIFAVREKIANQLLSDPKAFDKAAFIISLWINGKNLKKK